VPLAPDRTTTEDARVGNTRHIAATRLESGRAECLSGACQTTTQTRTIGRDEAKRRPSRLTALDVGSAAAAGDPVAVELIREGGRQLGRVLAGLVSFVNPGLIVIGGGVAGLGHVLLAEIRSVVYRQSLPLATQNLPIVMSELGGLAGVIGAARLGSEAVMGAPIQLD